MCGMSSHVAYLFDDLFFTILQRSASGSVDVRFAVGFRQVFPFFQ